MLFDAPAAAARARPGALTRARQRSPKDSGLHEPRLRCGRLSEPRQPAPSIAAPGRMSALTSEAVSRRPAGLSGQHAEAFFL